MTNKDLEKELREKYRKNYNGILSNEIIEKGIDFHLSFLKAKFNQVIDDMIGEERGKKSKSEFLRNPLKGNEYQDYYDGYNQKVDELKEYKMKFNK